MRNTDFIIACVIYTGNDTKIMRNSENNKNKISNIEKVMNVFILGFLLFLNNIKIKKIKIRNFDILNIMFNTNCFIKLFLEYKSRIIPLVYKKR